MKLTTKTQYGMRAIVDIAERGTKCSVPVPVSAISKREGIPVSYLEQLLNKLKKEGLVKSVRGPHGGYLLARDPSKIRVYDIVCVLEGNLALVSCVDSSRTVECVRVDGCITKILWQKLNKSIEGVLKSVTLKDLSRKSLKPKKTKALNHKFTYSI